jgi:hypothetical protein
MNSGDVLFKHSALHSTITPVRTTSTANQSGLSNAFNPSATSTNINHLPPSITHPSALPSNIPSSSSSAANTGHSSSNKRRVQAERAAIRQKIRNELHKQQNEIRKQRENTEKTKIWKDSILPHWNELVHTTKVKELCAKGIPSNIRGKVWPLLIGNELNVRNKLLSLFLFLYLSLFLSLF